ncbi:MAG: hypothetical protein ACREPB_09535 [Arenimonas sp.]
MSNTYPNLPFNLDNDRVTRAWAMSALFLFGVFAALSSAYYFDVRLLDGAPIWAKPIKFCLSLIIYFVTLAILSQQMARERRAGIGLTILGYAAVAAMLFEQIYISLQAARGHRSHFNIETQFEQLMYAFMGIGSLTLVLVSFVLGVMIWKYAVKNHSGFRLGSILGLTLGSVLTLIIAGYMSGTGSHLVNAAVSDANGIPIVGWSRTTGDLRVPHFLATHLMQILPLAGLIFDRLKLPARKLVLYLAVFLVLLCVALFAQALMGQSVLVL